MVVEVLVAQAEAVDALGQEVAQGMGDASGIAVVGEAPGEALEEAEAALDLPQEQRPGVGGDLAPVELGQDGTRTEPLEADRRVATLCHCPGSLCLAVKPLW